MLNAEISRSFAEKSDDKRRADLIAFYLISRKIARLSFGRRRGGFAERTL